MKFFEVIDLLRLKEEDNNTTENIKNLAIKVFGNNAVEVTPNGSIIVNTLGKILNIWPEQNSALLDFTDNESPGNFDYQNPAVTANSMRFMRNLKYFG